ncbi:hypothetical protein OC842_007165 [Tilletia horrida]|uniref:Uncharacterized protein n=1 Tax=Tilletia horrida TaxID=155126 RepID=A0AAN6G769_9BASI|nr:hypothetical protein OC842_007165 [Tilletia horrida]
MDWPPECFEWVPGQEGKRVRCTICAESASSSTGFKRSTAMAHAATARHTKALHVKQHVRKTQLPSSDDVANHMDGNPSSSPPHPFPLFCDDDLEPDLDVRMADDEQHKDGCSRAISPALTAAELPGRLDSDASDAYSSDGDESVNDAQLLDDVPRLQQLADGDFKPFPSRVVFLVHIIASNPRNPLSVPQIKLILQLLKWLGFSDTPSYDKYRKGVQEATKTIIRGEERVHELRGREDHMFCKTSIKAELARDFANPEARKSMTLYPRDDPDIIDFMDGQWAHAIRDARAPPMVRLLDGRHAFRDEPVQLADGRTFFVRAWFQKGGTTYGRGLSCRRHQQYAHLLVVTSEQEQAFSTTMISSTGPELARKGFTRVLWDDEEVEAIAEQRTLAAGREVFTIFVRVFIDDLSGAMSKRWDVHHALTFQNANLSRDYLGRDASMKLFSASPSASAAEIMEAFLDELGLEILGRQEASRKASPSSYASLLMAGRPPPQTSSGTPGHRTHGRLMLAHFSGNSTRKFEPAVHTPLELLHTVLLGYVKYLFRVSISALTDIDKTRLSAWLSDADVDGLALDANVRGGYLVRHAQSLNGKDFRAALQIMPTAINNLLHNGEHEDKLHDIAAAWYAAGRLGSLLYVQLIPRTELVTYKENLSDALRYFFWTMSKASPSYITTKPKLHLLVHAVQQIDELGPLSALTSEHFESFNSVIRSACIYSNRQRPSRDIATRLLLQQDIRHIVSGGRLNDGGQPGLGLQTLLSSKTGKLIVDMFGVASRKGSSAEGSVQSEPAGEVHHHFFADEAHAAMWLGEPAHFEEPDRTRSYQQVRSYVARGSKDIVKVDSCVKIHRVLARDQLYLQATTDLVMPRS